MLTALRRECAKKIQLGESTLHILRHYRHILDESVELQSRDGDSLTQGAKIQYHRQQRQVGRMMGRNRHGGGDGPTKDTAENTRNAVAGSAQLGSSAIGMERAHESSFDGLGALALDGGHSATTSGIQGNKPKIKRRGNRHSSQNLVDLRREDAVRRAIPRACRQ